MQLEFIQQLDEGRALSRVGQLSKVGPDSVMRLLFLELGAVVLFQNEKAAQKYAKNSLDSGMFMRWRMFGTDLYNAATALNSPEHRTKLGIRHGVINIPLLMKILRDASVGRAKNSDYAKFTMDAQRSFDISSSMLTGVRRRVGDFEHLSVHQREELLADMARYYGPFGGKSDMLDIGSTKAHTSMGKSLLMWALTVGAVATIGYQIGKRLGK